MQFVPNRGTLAVDSTDNEVDTLTDRDHADTKQEGNEPKKISLAEAVKMKLAQKKQQQASGGNQKFVQGGGQKLKNQNNNKKVNSTHRKMGG